MLSLKDLLEEGVEPLPDIAICSICGWRGPAEECGHEKEGDWEGGYYTIDTCPKCPDGGCIDNYDMSPQRLIEWHKWNSQQQLSNAAECGDTEFEWGGEDCYGCQ